MLQRSGYVHVALVTVSVIMALWIAGLIWLEGQRPASDVILPTLLS